MLEKEVAPRVGLPKSGDSNGIDSSADPKTVTQSRRVAEELSSGSAMPDSSENITALLPCPFCGGETIRLFKVFERDGFRVDCNACNGGFHKRTEAEAIVSWNTRNGAKP